MADLTSIAAFETLISDIAGSHESAAVKADLNIAGTAVSLLANTLVPNLAPTVNMTGIDAALTKILTGLSDLRVAVAPVATTTQETIVNA